jgi:hypothetical protein
MFSVTDLRIYIPISAPIHILTQSHTWILKAPKHQNTKKSKWVNAIAQAIMFLAHMQKDHHISCTTALSHPVIRVQIEKRDDNICLLTSVKSCFLLNDTKAITEQITKIFPLGGTRGYVMRRNYYSSPKGYCWGSRLGIRSYQRHSWWLPSRCIGILSWLWESYFVKFVV